MKMNRWQVSSFCYLSLHFFTLFTPLSVAARIMYLSFDIHFFQDSIFPYIFA